MFHALQPASASGAPGRKTIAMTTAITSTDQQALQAFDAEIQRRSLRGHWNSGLPPYLEPGGHLQPMHWSWSFLHDYIVRSGQIITVNDAGRRTIQLLNPGIKAGRGTSHTLQMSFQMVLPGELATAHRHSMNAIRFVVEGSGTFTTVNGESFLMEPGDLILTPAWTWHDHLNESVEPIIWIDGLDVPLVFALDTAFMEDYDQPQQRVNHVVRTSQDVMDTPDGARWYFKWRDTEEQVRQLAQATPAGQDVIFEYRQKDGRPTLPSLLCGVHLVRAGQATLRTRRTSVGLYHVVRGRGSVTIGDATFNWEKGDAITVPNWAWHQFTNADSSEDALLFFMSDRPVQEPFGWYREERQTADQVAWSRARTRPA